MATNDTHPEPSMFSILLGKSMLKKLFKLWLILVVAGSLIAVFAQQHAILEDFSLVGILTDSERLAVVNNIDYTPAETVPTTAPTDTATSSVPFVAVYPSRLYIPALGTDLPISNPQTRDIEALDNELLTATVRYPDSATVAQQGGNMLLFGHSSRLPVVRNKLFKAFNDIETLTTGDRIEITSGYDTYTYSVSRVYQASADDDKIALVVPGHRLTLLTCNSFGVKSDRWVVEAEYIGKNI